MTRLTIPDPAPVHISATGVRLRRLPRGEDPAGLRRGAPLLPGCCLSRPGEEPCYQQAEDEPADVGEERYAAAVRRGAEQSEARLDELVQEPQPEEDPGRDPDQEDREDPRPDPRLRVEDEVGAQHGGDGAAGAQLRYPRLSGRAEQQ